MLYVNIVKFNIIKQLGLTQQTK